MIDLFRWAVAGALVVVVREGFEHDKYNDSLRLSFAAPVYLSEEEEAMSLLQVAPERELAVLAVLNGLEMRSACRLDGIDELRRPGAGQERGRDGEAALLLHNTAARAHRAVPQRIQARATRRHLEKL